MDNTSERSVIGMDIAKNLFQLHVVSAETGEIRRIKLKRAAVESFFANTPTCLIAMEACGGAHHWGRTIKALGHEVKLLPTWHVKPFVVRDKTDARDA
jgi:transposase